MKAPEVIQLKSCPFCAGPPMPIVCKDMAVGGGAAPRISDYGENGMDVTAVVFCHECGAEGESVEERIYDAEDYDRAELHAVELWNQRDERNHDLFQAGAVSGLNQYPRANDPRWAEWRKA